MSANVMELFRRTRLNSRHGTIELRVCVGGNVSSCYALRCASRDGKDGCKTCAQIVPNRSQQEDSERYRTERQNFASLCNAEKLRGLSGAAEGLKIRRYLVPWGFDSPSRHQPQNHAAQTLT